jgi:hypothetical protein
VVALQLLQVLTEEYDGSSWTTSPGNLNTGRDNNLAGAGTQTAALAFGGALILHLLLQEQQKNMMEQVGQQVLEV